MKHTINISLSSEELHYLQKWRELHPSIKIASLAKELVFNYIKQEEYVIKNRVTHCLSFEDTSKNA